MADARTLALPDGRTLAFDDVGDPDGVPVLFCHGTPDSRRARHPDDELARRAGVRLVAADRPGIGSSSPHPSATVGSVADDLVVLADHLGVDRWRPLAWSAGAPFALGLAARHPDRVAPVAVAAGLVPFAAYATAGILDDADGGRHLVAELGAELGAAAMADMAAPMLAPYPCDLALARDHVVESPDPVRRQELAEVDGAVDALAAGVVEAVAQGLDGLHREVELQATDPGVDWRRATAPVTLTYGALDATAPPAFGRWWLDHLPDARLEVVPDAGHLVALTRWAAILGDLSRPG